MGDSIQTWRLRQRLRDSWMHESKAQEKDLGWNQRSGSPHEVCKDWGPGLELPRKRAWDINTLLRTPRLSWSQRHQALSDPKCVCSKHTRPLSISLSENWHETSVAFQGENPWISSLKWHPDHSIGSAQPFEALFLLFFFFFAWFFFLLWFCLNP